MAAEPSDADKLRLMAFFAFDVKKHMEEHSTWEKHHIDKAYDEEAEAMVIMPQDKSVLPAPVLLFLLGQGQVDGRQPFEAFGLDILLRNEHIRSRFTLVIPKPSTKNGLVRYTGEGWKKEWAQDGVWSIFTEVLRRLGPEKVDPARLYATGISMGAAGVWHMAISYGEYFAAVAPISGACQWPGDTWPRRAEPRADVLERLHKLPMRAFQIDNDEYAGNPLRDIEYLTYDLTEKKREVKISGIDQSKIDVTVRTWCWDKDNAKGAATLELWWVAGPLTDNVAFKEKDGSISRDDHCLWLRVFPNMQWGMSAFFLRHTVPQERCFSFSSKPIILDTSAERAALKEKWGEPPDESRPDGPLNVTVGSEEEVAKLLEQIGSRLRDTLKAANGRKVAVTLQMKAEDPPPAPAAGEAQPKAEPNGTEAKAEAKQNDDKAKEPPQVELSIFWNANNNKDKVDLKVKQGEVIFVVKMMVCGGDLQKAMSFGLGVKPASGAPKKLPDDHKLLPEERILCVC